jgi:hypothetical protein
MEIKSFTAMKNSVILIGILSIIAFSTCSKYETSDDSTAKGEITFGFSFSRDGINMKSTGCDADLGKISGALISIENEDGEQVYELKKIAIYKFNDDYISEPLSLNTGLFKLTAFLLIDCSGTVLYATPLESSDKANVVDNPLPLEFAINKDEVTKVVAEVISIEDSAPEDFGYNSFSFVIVEDALSFYLSVLVYNSSIKNYELTGASLVITHCSDTLYNDYIGAVTNNILLQSIYDNYKIDIYKPGYYPYSGLFTADSLVYYKNKPLVILLEEENGPEIGLAAYYPFNGDAKDMSGNNNNGIVYGATLVADRKGNPNSAYYFDGIDDYISVPGSPSLNPSHQLTIALWLNMDVITTHYTPVLHKGGVNYDEFANREYLIFIESIVKIYAESAGDNSTHHFLGCDFPGLKTWFHFTAVFDRIGHKMKLYMNGEKVKEANDSYSTFNNNNDSLKIATWDERNSSYANFYKGYIDDIYIYTRALSDSEVKEIFSQ